MLVCSESTGHRLTASNLQDERSVSPSRPQLLANNALRITLEADVRHNLHVRVE